MWGSFGDCDDRDDCGDSKDWDGNDWDEHDDRVEDRKVMWWEGGVSPLLSMKPYAFQGDPGGGGGGVSEGGGGGGGVSSLAKAGL